LSKIYTCGIDLKNHIEFVPVISDIPPNFPRRQKYQRTCRHEIFALIQDLGLHFAKPLVNLRAIIHLTTYA